MEYKRWLLIWDNQWVNAFDVYHDCSVLRAYLTIEEQLNNLHNKERKGTLKFFESTVHGEGE